MLFVLAVLLLSRMAYGNQVEETPPLYEEQISSSDSVRTEQAQELADYLEKIKSENVALNAIFHPDYTSPSAYVASTARLQRAVRDSLGYPPPGQPDTTQLELRRVGEDALGAYYKMRVSVLPGVHVVGLYIVPNARHGRVPLVIAMHGGNGSPEAATFHGGANYHDMVRGAVQHGYVVWAPQHLYNPVGFPADIRSRLDARARQIGTTITAIEIAKIIRGLNVILKRPEVDKNRVVMVGLSYGGLYTLLTTALEPRIKAAVSSCYYSEQTAYAPSGEPDPPGDVRFWRGMSVVRDVDAASLVCPRPLEIQMGVKDDIVSAEAARLSANAIEDHYTRLGLGAQFQFVAFDGGHEFYGPSAWTFLARHL